MGKLIAGGGDARSDGEWVLKQNTKYLIVVTSGADNNNVSLVLGWYEHTDKVAGLHPTPTPAPTPTP